jgi:Cytochrome c554 and c-prime
MPETDKPKPSSRKNQPSHSPVANPRLWPRWLAIVGAVVLGVVVLGVVGFASGTLLEENDSFCGSCHTVPETTYLDRSGAASVSASAVVSDLATFHYHQALTNTTSFQCIVCHRGTASLGDRAQTLALALKDTVTLVSGHANPAIERSSVVEPALVNAACVACHETTLLTQRGTATHFHNLLAATKALVAQGKQMTGNGRNRENRQFDTSITCTDCHLAHKTVDTSNTQYMLVDKATTQVACDNCHKAANQRSQSFDRIFNGGGD